MLPGRHRHRWLIRILVSLVLGAAPHAAFGVTPGEATDLLVTGYDTASGNLSLSWTPACGAADHHIEFGPLQDVGTYGYSGQACGIGTTGSIGSFNPGPGSYFFIVVGDDGIGIEGSYGTSTAGGAYTERPESAADPSCALVQDLSQRCDGPFLPSLDMAAFRPQSEGYGSPLTRRAIPMSEEIVPGAGIRINGDDDNLNGLPDSDDVGVTGENDLIEVVLTVDPPSPAPGYEYILTRSGPGIRAWEEAGKSTAIFGSGTEAVLAFSAATRTIWVESPSGGGADLEFAARPTAGGADVASDLVHFRPLTSVVIALGGESQVPADPPLEPANHGTFQLAIALYQLGYDVHMYDEDVVSATGAGAAYNEVVSAVRDRGISSVAIYGYSHGGGSTNDLARRLNDNRGSIGVFSIDYTAYVDGIDNDSDIDIGTETALPPSTEHHANYYEHPGCGFFALCGGPIAGADLNLNVTAQPWGSGLTHFTIDDAPEVLQGILDQLRLLVAP
jgi:hypothetical protein